MNQYVASVSLPRGVASQHLLLFLRHPQGQSRPVKRGLRVREENCLRHRIEVQREEIYVVSKERGGASSSLSQCAAYALTLRAESRLHGKLIDAIEQRLSAFLDVLILPLPPPQRCHLVAIDPRGSQQDGRGPRSLTRSSAGRCRRRDARAHKEEEVGRASQRDILRP